MLNTFLKCLLLSVFLLWRILYLVLWLFFFDWVVCFFDVYLFESSSTIFSDDIFLWLLTYFFLWTQKHRSHFASLLSSLCSSLFMTTPLRAWLALPMLCMELYTQVSRVTLETSMYSSLRRLPDSGGYFLLSFWHDVPIPRGGRILTVQWLPFAV